MTRLAPGLILALVSFVVVTAPTSSVAAAAPINKIEARQMPSRKLTRKVIDQLADILVATPYPTRKGHRPVRALSDQWFWTRPHAARTVGLCTSDGVIVNFEPTSSRVFGARTPVKAVGLSASPRYYFLAPPSPEALGELKLRDRAAANAACAKLDPDKDHFLEAADEETAVESVWRFSQAITQARQSHVPFTLSCDGDPKPTDEQCRAKLAQLDLKQTDSISTCQETYEGEPATSCIYAYLSDTGVRIIVPLDSSKSAVRVDLQQLVVVADWRID